MLLAINANNTNTVFAVWDGDKLRGVWRAATDARRTADEYVVWLDHLLGLADLSRRYVDATVIASVVPEANFNLRRLCREYCHSEPLVVGEPGVALGTKAVVDRPRKWAPTGSSTRWPRTSAIAGRSSSSISVPPRPSTWSMRPAITAAA